MAFPLLNQVTEMLHSALADRLAPGGKDYLDRFAEAAVFEFPFSPGGAVHKEGKRDMAASLCTIEDGVAFERFTLKASYPGADGRTVVLKHDGQGGNQTTVLPYAQSYVSVVQLSGGRITLFREYLNPLAAAAESTQPDQPGKNC